MDKRREKINELKVAIKGATEELKTASEALKAIKNKTVSDEEKKKLLNDMMQARSVCEALAEELKLTRLNKLSSSFFEWIPSPANRRMRRAMFRNFKFKKLK
jgi:hypothetical protein